MEFLKNINYAGVLKNEALVNWKRLIFLAEGID
jgi:hypothetical protein